MRLSTVWDPCWFVLTVVMRNTRKFRMDAGDLRELDEIMETLRPHFRV